jgi:hypothetical protein
MFLLRQVTFLHVHFQNTTCPVNKGEVIGFHECSHRPVSEFCRVMVMFILSNNVRIRILNVKMSAEYQFCLSDSVCLNEANLR